MQQLCRTKATVTSEKKDVYTVVTNRIVDLLNRGVVPWKPCTKDSNGTVRLPMNGYSSHRYQGINVLTLLGEQLANGYSTNRWFTMRQINTLGARVQKGQSGTPIIFARYIDRKENGKVVLDKDGNPVQRYFLTYTHGWNSEQTSLTVEQDEADLLDPLQRQGEANDLLMGYLTRERIELTHVGAQAYYQPSNDLINLPDFCRAISPARWFEAGFHEAVHSTGHPKRLARLDPTKPASKFGPEYAKEELIAELGAAYILSDFGIFEEQIDNLTDYINHWIEVLEGNKNLIFQASSKAQAAVAFIKEGATA